MVTAVTSFGRSGLADWLVQRVSSVVLLAYTLFIVGFLITADNLDFQTWSSLFSALCVKIFTLMALISTAAHGWIGLWGVLTDYATDRLMGSKAVVIRLFVLFVYGVITVAYLIWGVDILWGQG